MGSRPGSCYSTFWWKPNSQYSFSQYTSTLLVHDASIFRGYDTAFIFIRTVSLAFRRAHIIFPRAHKARARVYSVTSHLSNCALIDGGLQLCEVVKKQLQVSSVGISRSRASEPAQSSSVACSSEDIECQGMVSG